MSGMKVALVGSRNFPARHGGLEVVVEKLALELADRQVRVHVFVGDLAPQNGNVVDAPNGGQVTLHRTKSIKGKYWHTASQIVSGLAQVRSLKPDIVNIHGVGPAFPLAVSRRAFGNVPTLVTAHGLDWEREKWPSAARWIFRRIAVRALKNATSVSSVAESVGTDLGRLLGSPVVTTLNGMDAIEVQPRRVIDLPDRYTVVLSRLTPEKNLEQVIFAYTPAVAENLGPLVIIGGGESSYSGDYEKQLRDAAQGRDIIFMGHQSRESALSIVADASAFISTSALEARPMAVLEAMYLRVPIILSDIAPHRELAGDSARYVSLNDHKELTELLLSCDLNEERRVVEAYEKVAAMTWDRSADSYLSWYQSSRMLTRSRRG